VTRNLDKIIDINKYPVEQAAISNLIHRPIGIGVSGLADAYCKMGYPFDSQEAAALNKLIFETISYAAYTESTKLAKEKTCGKKPNRADNTETARSMFNRFETFKTRKELIEQYKKLVLKRGTALAKIKALEDKINAIPFSFVSDARISSDILPCYPSYYYGDGAQSTFQWKLWPKTEMSGMWDWSSLEDHIKVFGLRNSMLTATMPTATTAHILGVNEAFEPFTSNVYRRKVLAGEITIVNSYLIQDLIDLGIWNDDIANYLKGNDGSVQDIDGIPDSIKQVYKTVWEMSQKVIIDQARDRAPFIDHTQSMNLFLGSSTVEQVNSMLKYAWKKGLKTGIYYLKSRPAVQPQKFSLPIEIQQNLRNKGIEREAVVVEEEGCLSCGT